MDLRQPPVTYAADVPGTADVPTDDKQARVDSGLPDEHDATSDTGCKLGCDVERADDAGQVDCGPEADSQAPADASEELDVPADSDVVDAHEVDSTQEDCDDACSLPDWTDAGDLSIGDECNDTGPDVCAPVCAGKECGDDGCGGSCGQCLDSLPCTDDVCSNGSCQFQLSSFYCVIAATCLPSGAENPANPCEKCLPVVSSVGWSPLDDSVLCGAGKVCHLGSCCNKAGNCIGRECGSDLCGGECGVCEGPQDECIDGTCVCLPDCAGMECGDDGCGAQCGECPGPQDACIDGECACVPDCAFKQCGADGCGESCGSCGVSESCTVSGKCGVVTSYCGTGICWSGENCDNCPKDCGPCCGNGKCQQYYLESCGTCPLDCGYCEISCDDGNEIDWDGCTDGIITEFQVNTETEDDQFDAAAAGLDPEGFVIVWTGDDQDGDKYGIFGRRYSAAGWPASPEFQVNLQATGDQMHPNVAGIPGGAFVVVWQSEEQDSSGPGVFARIFSTAQGMPGGPEIVVPTWVAEGQERPDVAVLGQAKLVIVWEGAGYGDAHGVFARIFGLAGNPLGNDFPVNTTKSEPQVAPAVATSASGKAVVVWQGIGEMETGWNIYGRRIDADGAPIGPEFKVSEGTGGSHERPSVASLPDDGFVVVWQAKEASQTLYEVAVQRYAADGTKKGAKTLLNAQSGGDQLHPVVAVSSFSMSIAWEGYSTGNLASGAYGRFFSPEGTPLVAMSQLSVYLAGDRLAPCSTALAGDTFLAAWHSRDQDGDVRGVFAQRFDSNGKRIYH